MRGDSGIYHYSPTLEENFNTAAKMRGLTVADIARAAKVDWATVSSIRYGYTACKLFVFDAVCDALNVPMEWLFYGRGPDPFADKNSKPS